ncbi:MAG: gliding motility lipoprotein GldH [Bacteroidota bacterium]
MKKLILLPIMLFLFSCNENRLINQYEGVPQLNWEKNYIPSYTLNIEDAAAKYKVMIGLRHISEISYGEVLVNLKMTIPSGEVIETPYILELRDKTSGELKGSAMGDITDIEVAVEENFTFPESGEYKFSISHQMEQETLSGVMEVGLVVDKLKE